MDDFAEAYLMTKLGHPELAGWWGKLLGGGGAKTLYTIGLKQQGTGDPAPDNVRPILPGLTLVRDDDSVLEVYGGTLDTASGVLTVTHEIVTNDGTVFWMIASGFNPIAFYRLASGPSPSGNVVGVFSHFRLAQVITNAGYGAKFYVYNGLRIIVRFDDDYSEKPTTADEMKAWCMTQAQRGTPFQAVYPLATPVTYQLTQAEVKRAVRELKNMTPEVIGYG